MRRIRKSKALNFSEDKYVMKKKKGLIRKTADAALIGLGAYGAQKLAAKGLKSYGQTTGRGSRLAAGAYEKGHAAKKWIKKKAGEGSNFVRGQYSRRSGAIGDVIKGRDE